jgi:hypothetical protein
MGTVFQYLAFLQTSTRDAEHEATIYSIVFAVGGVVLCPLTGVVCDLLTLPRYIVMLFLLLVAFVGLMWTANFYVVLSSFIVMVIYYSAWSNMVMKWAVIYSPPALVGTYYGVTATASGLVQLALNFAIPAISAALINP